MKKLLTAGALAMGMMSNAQAGLISIVSDGDSFAFVSPANNDVFGAGLNGVIGASIYVTDDVKLTFTYLGKEAAYVDKFYVGSSLLFTNNPSSPIGSTSVAWASTGLLDFRFTIGSGPIPTVTNAGNNGAAAANFYASSDSAFDSKEWRSMPGIQTFASMGLTLGPDSIVIALDDSGAGPDDNHDDLVVHIKAEAVPEPGVLGLLGLGLAGIGFGASRRRS